MLYVNTLSRLFTFPPIKANIARAPYLFRAQAESRVYKSNWEQRRWQSECTWTQAEKQHDCIWNESESAQKACREERGKIRGNIFHREHAIIFLPSTAWKIHYGLNQWFMDRSSWSQPSKKPKNVRGESVSEGASFFSPRKHVSHFLWG